MCVPSPLKDWEERKALTALPALVEALSDESKLVRNSSAEALRKIGTPEALEAIEEVQI